MEAPQIWNGLPAPIRAPRPPSGPRGPAQTDRVGADVATFGADTARGRCRDEPLTSLTVKRTVVVLRSRVSVVSYPTP